jgi:hypothetical protein
VVDRIAAVPMTKAIVVVILEMAAVAVLEVAVAKQLYTI